MKFYDQDNIFDCIIVLCIFIFIIPLGCIFIYSIIIENFIAIFVSLSLFFLLSFTMFFSIWFRYFVLKNKKVTSNKKPKTVFLNEESILGL